jgi:F-type H+-transporting ATPase subunit gamma
MAATLRAVRARIRAVQSISKITRAQELIASSRIVRAQQQMRAAEPYSRGLTDAVSALLSRTTAVNHPMVTRPATIRKAAVIILTSDSGFAGAYNASVLREASRLRQRLSEENTPVDLYVVGRKGIGWHRFRDIAVADEWSGFSARPHYPDAQKVTERVLQNFGPEGDTDEIYLVATEFVSMLTQRPVVRRLLPLEVEESSEQPPQGPLPQYEFEPSPDIVFARGGGVRTRRPPSRDEGGDRQRERPARPPHSRGEQRQAGRDHPGNQRNRRRCQRAG